MLEKHRGAVKEQFFEMFEEIKSIARKGYTMFRLASGDVQAEWDVEDIDRQIESSDFAAFDGQEVAPGDLAVVGEKTVEIKARIMQRLN